MVVCGQIDPVEAGICEYVAHPLIHIRAVRQFFLPGIAEPHGMRPNLILVRHNLKTGPNLPNGIELECAREKIAVAVAAKMGKRPFQQVFLEYSIMAGLPSFFAGLMREAHQNLRHFSAKDRS
jgi:hypothetical protein